MNKTLAIKNGLKLLIRGCLAVGLLFCVYLVSNQAVAFWYSGKETPEGVRKAIQWDSRNPEYYARLARLVQYPLEDGNLSEAIRLYEKATQLSPHEAGYWAGLGHAYEWAGQLENAQRAYERAKLLFPNSPVINWKLGNFYLRAGKVEQALQAFQKTILEDPGMRRPAFDLAWRATEDGKLIEAALIPAREDIYFQYLYYLLETQRMDEAAEIWDRLLQMGFRFEPKAAFPYLDALIQHRRIDQLKMAWAKLLERNPTQIRKRVTDPNLITNGGFESEILNGGLDWRVIPTEGVVVGVDSVTFLDGVRSLRVQFDGKHNLNYEHIYQYVPVEPNTSYRFMGYMRAQNITTDSGPRFQFYDAYDSAKLFLQTDNLTATSSWSLQRLEFKTGPDTRLLVIRLARPPSRKFGNQIAGTVWVDRVALNAVE